MDWIPLLYFLIAWYTGGQLFRRLCYVELFQPLSTELQPHYGLIPDGRVWSFSYWHMLLVLLCNPVVVLHYADISAALCAFFYAVALIVYQFVCYCMFLYLLLHFSYRMWHIAKRYNRGSIVRHSFYFLRCYIRDLHEGHSAMPHLLHTSLLFCFLWGATRCVLSETLMIAPITIFVVRWTVRDMHCGLLCRPISLLVALLCGLLACIPATVLCIILAIETLYPTMGDEEAVVSDHPGYVAAMHPGYMGTGRLDRPWTMPPDGLCL